MKKGVSRICISMPPDLLKEFEDVRRGMGYGDRSKAVHAALRSFISDNKWIRWEEGMGVGAITMVYDHDVKGLEEALTDIQHLHQSVISSSMHIHLDERNCLEIIAVRGYAKTIRDLAQRLMTERGVKQLRLSIVAP
jgi:CopG family nickel-responsive transcriptional regulator